MAAIIYFPKGEWFLTPMYFAESSDYLKAIMKSNDSPELPVTEPFSFIYLAGNSQVSKCIVFIPFEGKADRNILEPGIFFISFYVQYENESFSLLTKRKIIIEKDQIDEWRNGTTIGGEQFERDTQVEPLLRKLQESSK